MTYLELFNEALKLCIKAKSHAIAHDLHAMTESELQGVIYFLTSMIVN